MEATYTYYASGNPGDMYGYGLFYVPHGWQMGSDFYLEAHVYPGLIVEWRSVPVGGVWLWQSGYPNDTYYFTAGDYYVIDPENPNVDPETGRLVASIRLRIYKMVGDNKVILATGEMQDVGTEF